MYNKENKTNKTLAFLQTTGGKNTLNNVMILIRKREKNNNNSRIVSISV